MVNDVRSWGMRSAVSAPTRAWQSASPVPMQVIDDEKENPAQMAYAYKMTWIWAITLSIVIFVLWPLLVLPAGIFSQGYFTFWVILSMVRTSSEQAAANVKYTQAIL